MIKELLDQSNDLHIPLIPDDNTLEQSQLKEPVVSERIIMAPNKDAWEHLKRGSLENPTQYGFQLCAPTRYDTWAPGDPSDGDYVGYGETMGILKLDRENWDKFNQIRFRIKTDCINVINPDIIFQLKNDGQVKIPDEYNREGYHVINLKNHHEQDYILNIGDIPRDAITEIGFSWEINGSYQNIPGTYRVQISQISLQQTQQKQVTHGWQPQTISYSHIGYETNSSKIAIIPNDKNQAKDFEIYDVSHHQVALQSAVKEIHTTMGNFSVLDFSSLSKPGSYQIKWQGQETESFKINTHAHLWTGSIPKILNFIYAQRCGYPVPGIHGICHQDVIAKHAGKTISYNGGWHDAGDLSQQLIHTAEATYELFKTADQIQESHPKLSARLVEEGNWGLDFIYRTDYGDGYHATSAGVSRWTDNQIGTMDDALARVHNNPYENYLLSSLLARIAQLSIIDSASQNRIQESAVRNFGFAEEEFHKHPYEKEPIFWEHTLNTSSASYNATIVCAAAALYQLTKQQNYLQRAEEAMTELLKCQETKGIQLDSGEILKGPFYRNQNHRVFQHFNHQAREALFAEAFDNALKLPVTDHQLQKWHERAQMYGEYLLYLEKFTAPYPMIASGVYLDSENTDSASFKKQHLLIDDKAVPEFSEQLQAGVKVAKHLYVRRFPVWFSFRGNNGVILSSGTAAAILGRVLRNPRLSQLAAAQLRWIVGNNPFNQSLMYGEGHNYTQQYTNSSGEMVGELPVGVETKDNEDQPYWPQFNNATYKEVWIVTATKWLAIVSELIKTEDEKNEQ